MGAFAQELPRVRQVRAVGAEQASLAAPDSRAEFAARDAGVRKVRLRVVPLVGADHQTKALLLSLSGFRRLSLSERSGLR